MKSKCFVEAGELHTRMLKELVSNFQMDGKTLDISPYGDGHINDTYLVTTTERKYMLQSINSNVFQSPKHIMENILKITNHIHNKVVQYGGDPSRETLNIVPLRNGKNYFKTPEGEYYRMFIFIEGARTYQAVEKTVHFYNAAKAFAKFQKMLSDFPAKELHEPIPDFHNTRVRLSNLKNAAKRDPLGRVASVQRELEFAMERADDVGIILDLIDSGDIPVRVTHNDTKYNNIMIDDKTGEGICVIDLDTVMPGSLLYDFGDSLRFGTNPAAEDEKDLSKVYMVPELFEAFAKGFLEIMAHDLSEAEIEYMPFSAKLMTFECGMRFLTDYIEGDTYFKTQYKGQNLDRARTQFKLTRDMETKMDLMKGIVQKHSLARIR